MIWTEPAPWFGGFSGLEVSADGRDALLITDRGSLVRAQLIRTGGTLTAVQLLDRTELKHANGRAIKGRGADAEGLAVTAQSDTFVSFEGIHRLVLVNQADAVTTRVPGHSDFDNFERNKGLEALAVHPDGTLYTLPERTGTQTDPFPLFAYTGGVWTRHQTIPRRGPFQPVGADFDDQGRLYLLERAVTPLGFRSRVRRFDLAARHHSEITLLTTPPGRYDNLEALSLWRDDNGTTRLTLVSDDNFLSIQRTQFIEFILKD